MMHKHLSLKEQFRAWLDTKSGPYKYEHCEECAMGQFLRDKYGPDVTIRVDRYWFRVNGSDHELDLSLANNLRMAKTFEDLRVLMDSDHTRHPMAAFGL